MKIELADIATNEKRKLNGFRVLGVFPFYLKYITTGTHIKLCKIREQIQSIVDGDPEINDFYDYKIQSKSVPLINEYVVTALVNSRWAGWIYKFFLKRKLKRCGQSHILNLFITIQQLDEPAFFFSYWKLINQKDHTLLKEVKPS
jgi:hypothetical protein